MKKPLKFLTIVVIGVLSILVFGMGTNSLGKFTTTNASVLILQDPTEVPNPTESNGRGKQEAIEGHGNIFDLAWSPDGRRLAVADTFGVWVYNMEEVDEAPLFIDSQNEHVFAVSFAYDNVTLGYGDDTGFIHLWDISNSAELARIQTHVGTIWDLERVRKGHNRAKRRVITSDMVA